MRAEGIPPSPDPWVGRIRSWVRRLRGAGLGPELVVAVSGGSDSVGLLRVLHDCRDELDLSLSVAHLDHGARAGSAADARFVADLADDLGLPFDLGSWTPTRSSHFEADARRARHAWLTEVARVRGASAVAVGHTRDDQAETILHRILRGTGPAGLSGMSPRRPLSDGIMLLRPLLGVPRLEIRSYLAAIGQSYRDDPTNADRARTRARIRHDLLPKLAEDYNPAIADALVRLGRLSGASSRLLRDHLDAMEESATVSVGPGAVVLDAAILRQFPQFTRTEVLRRAWRRAGWPEVAMGADRWDRLASLARRERGRISVGSGIEASVSAGRLILERRSASTALESLELAIPGTVAWDGGRVVATLDVDAPRDESIDLNSLALPLVVRPPEDGDRFEPLGMDGRSMPLNDFFRGRRVHRNRRQRIPLVCDRSGIVWVVGQRIAHRVRRTEATRDVLGLRWEPPQIPRGSR